MPAPGYKTVTVRSELIEICRALVELEIPPYDDLKKRGIENYQATVLQDLAEKAALAIINGLPEELQVKIWRRKGTAQRTILDVQEGGDGDVPVRT